MRLPCVNLWEEMRSIPVIALVVSSAAGFGIQQAHGQGLPARVAPSDYQTQVKVGTVTLAAEFAGHGVPTEQGAFTTEDFVVVEAGLYGPAGARLFLDAENFSLRINGKKNTISTEPAERVFSSLRDPEWTPPETEKKSKTSLGGNNQEGNTPPPPVKIPIELQRSMSQKTLKAAFPAGDRPLPQAGLLFFPYRGKAEKINSVELYYDGPAGKTSVTLQ